MLLALRHPVYLRLFLAQAIALVGTGLATVAIGLTAYELEPSRAGSVLGTALAIKMVAYVVVAPMVAALAVRLPRKGVLVAADVVRLAGAVSLVWIGEAWQLYAVVLVMQAASATFTPTFQALIPEVLEDEESYTAALSLSRLAYDLEAIASPLLAAALLLVVSSPVLFVGTAIGFSASALLVTLTGLPPRQRAEPAPFVRRLALGTRRVVAVPELRPVLALNLAVAAAGAVVLVETVVIVRRVLGLDDGAVAVVLAANGAGSMLAAAWMPMLLRRRDERSVMLGGGASLACAIAVVPIALSIDPPAAVVAVCVLWALAGAGASAIATPIGRLVRRHVVPAERGDAFAAQFALSHACWLGTYPLVGWLGDVDVRLAALVAAGIAAVALAVAGLLWPRSRAMAS